jgi:hypothetical protein
MADMRLLLRAISNFFRTLCGRKAVYLDPPAQPEPFGPVIEHVSSAPAKKATRKKKLI